MLYFALPHCLFQCSHKAVKSVLVGLGQSFPNNSLLHTYLSTSPQSAALILFRPFITLLPLVIKYNTSRQVQGWAYHHGDRYFG